MVKSKPKIILSAAMSIDGKIATSSGDSKLSSKNDLIRVHKLRSKVDAVLIGKKTLEQDNPLLTVRYVKGKNPVRIILSSQGKISLKSRILKTARQFQTIVSCSEKISKKNKHILEANNIQVIISGKNSINLKKLLRTLYKQNIKSILLEGGGNTNWKFIQENLVDEIIITVTPFVIGGKNSTSLVDGSGFAKIFHSKKFKLLKVNRLKDELVLHYRKL